ncbi:MAG: ArsA-related P-loop ATPase [Myxococcota bacterium]
MSTDLDHLLDGGRCLVCVGPGGVGKTSAAGALGLACAHAGHRTAVLTIDPARRLANALGLPEIGNTESDISAQAFESRRLVAPPARLSAMMLDIKQAWDEVVARHHPSEEGRKRLLANPMYQALSTALAGSQEYMAMEKLYQLAHRETDPLDRIILDTPPAHHAVDFLEAPNKIVDALSNDATRWLLEPLTQKNSVGRRLFDVGSGLFIRTVARLTGNEILSQLGQLLEGFQAMMDGFSERARAVDALLSSEATRFVVVSRPTPDGVVAAGAFVERLRARSALVAAVVLNRAPLDLPDVGPRRPLPEGWVQAVEGAGGTPILAQRVHDAACDAADARAVARDRALELAGSTGLPIFLIPQLDVDVADLAGLDALRRKLTLAAVHSSGRASSRAGSVR